MNVQFELFQQMLTNVLGPWTLGSSKLSETNEFGHLIQACESQGSRGLISALGFDQLIDDITNWDSIYMRLRIQLNHNVRSVLAVCRRLCGTVNRDQVRICSINYILF